MLIAVDFACGGLLITVIFSEDAAAMQIIYFKAQKQLKLFSNLPEWWSIHRALGTVLNRKNYDAHAVFLHIPDQLWRNQTWNQTRLKVMNGKHCKESATRK